MTLVTRLLVVSVGCLFALAACADTTPPDQNDPPAQNDQNDDTNDQNDDTNDQNDDTNDQNDDTNDQNDDTNDQNDDNDQNNDEECEPHPDEQLCEEAGYECGEVELTDNCDEQRTVQCDECPDEHCLDDNQCECVPDSCKDLGDTCGVRSDGCGGQIMCNSGCANPIGLGSFHTCLMQHDGGVECWGWNDDSQLGTDEDDDGNSIDYATDGLAVEGIDDEQFVQVFAGFRHTCAKDEDGTVYCWGDNEDYQLTDLAGDESAEAVELTNLAGSATTIGTGANFSCAEIDPGHLQCWGDNWQGQLGVGDDSSTYESPVDTNFVGNDDESIVAFDGGPLFGCYTDGDGEVYCWGKNTFGQVGNQDYYEDLVEPTQVTVDIDTPVQDLSTGGTENEGPGDISYTYSGFTCVIDANDTLECWGYNGRGQLGIEPPDPGSGDDDNLSLDPVEIEGLDNPEQVAAGGEHACAIEQGGTVKCWGYNEFGQLGAGTWDTYSTEPLEVETLDDPAQAIFAGTHHTCALVGHGDFKCWGRNEHGQLGDGTTEDRNEPVSAIAD